MSVCFLGCLQLQTKLAHTVLGWLCCIGSSTADHSSIISFLLFNETTQLAEISPPTTNGAAAVFTMAQMLSNWSWRPFSTDFWTCTFSAKTLSLIWISLRQCILCINTGPLHSTESQKNKIIKTQLCLYLTVPIGKSSRSLFFLFFHVLALSLSNTSVLP